MENAEKTDTQLTDPFIGGTEAQLNFIQKLDHQTVIDLVNDALKQLKLGDKEVSLEVRNDKYFEGDRASYNEWSVKIGLPAEQANQVFTALNKSLSASPLLPRVECHRQRRGDKHPISCLLCPGV